MTQKTVHLQKNVITDLYAATGISSAKTLIIQNVGAHTISLSINANMDGKQTIFADSEPWENLIPGAAYALSENNCDISVSDESFKPAGQQGEKRPIGLFWGMRAITQQNYIEANVKNGAQFYVHFAYPSSNVIPAGGVRNFLFKTGDTPVLFKMRIVNAVGFEFSHAIYVNPTVSDYGTQMTVGNFAGSSGNLTTVECYRDATITAIGTAIDAEPEYYFGSATAPSRSNAIFTNGIERALSNNTLYLVQIINEDNSATGRFQWFGTWYEGERDLPRPEGELD